MRYGRQNSSIIASKQYHIHNYILVATTVSRKNKYIVRFVQTFVSISQAKYSNLLKDVIISFQ